MYYTKISLKAQAKVIKKHFGITMKLPKKSTQIISPVEHQFLIPQWRKIASTYNEALQKVLDAIKSTRPFYNWVDGKIGPECLRESATKGTIPEIISAQFGELHKGQSVEKVRKDRKENEILLGAYEIGIMLLTHPDRLTKWEDLWIDCAGDEYNWPVSDVRFDRAPVFRFSDGRVRFGARHVGSAGDGCGAASGFFPQSNLAPRPPLTLLIL
jgi:hypothetical protein